MTPKDLEVFLGKWRKAGRAHESPFGPAATAAAVETFDWLECRPLLLQRRRHERVEVSHRDEAWLFSGSWNLAVQALKVRCRLSFDDPNTMAARWEYSGGGNRWQVFWDTTLTRA